MTDKEQKTIDQLYKLVADIKLENKVLTQEIAKVIDSMNEKVEKKHMPITLEQDILSTVQASMQKAIQESLTQYNSPLVKLVTEVVNANSKELKEIIASSFNEVIKLDDFKSAIKTGFSHKIARTIISNNDGLFDKVSNDLKQDSVFKSKMALAVANVVNECLEERRGKS
jgi:hypothetical protein